MTIVMTKEQAFKHIDKHITRWPQINDTLPGSKDGWYWVRKKALASSVVFQSASDVITRHEFGEWRRDPVTRDTMLNWAKLNLKIWPKIQPDMVSEVLPGWRWRHDFTPEGNRPSFVLEGAVGSHTKVGIATINEADWFNYHTPPPSIEDDEYTPKPVKPIMKFFEYEHLPAHLQNTSHLVYNMAHALNNGLPDNAEKAAGLRKLLEAKDCFVRAAL